MSPKLRIAVAACGFSLLAVLLPAADTVATAIYARIGNGYSREKGNDGRFKPEYYALSNGGRIFGTTGDITVDRVTYPQVAEIAMRLLAGQNYHYAQSKEQAKLLLVLHWGNTIAFDRITYDVGLNAASTAYSQLVSAMGPRGAGPGANWHAQMRIINATSATGGPPNTQTNEATAAEAAFETEMLKLLMQNRMRDEVNGFNAKVIGYLDDLNDSNDIRRWAGGGDRYNDLIGDVEETRYYIVISAYDFPELQKSGKKTLLWQTRVSVRSPGNSFDDSYVAMLKSASKYFGQDHRRLIREEETKGTVELGDLKFLGVAKDRPQSGREEGR